MEYINVEENKSWINKFTITNHIKEEKNLKEIFDYKIMKKEQQTAKKQ